MSDSNSQRKKVMWIVWGALVWSLVIYTVVAFITKQNATPPPPETVENLKTMLPVLGGAALMDMIIIFFVLPKVLLKKATPTKVSMQGYFVYGIIRWALAEAICIFGLVYAFTGGSFNVYLAFFGCSLAIMLVCAPTQRDQENYDNAAEGN